MKTKGWILTVVSSMALVALAGIIVFMMLPRMSTAKAMQEWWWVFINLCVMGLLSIYGIRRGLQMLSVYKIPASQLKRSPGVVVCDYSITLKQYAFYRLWDFRHFSFSLLLVIYMCLALGTGHYIFPGENSLFSPLIIWFLCLVYILIMLPLRLNRIYKQNIAGQTWIEIAPEGLTYDKKDLKQTLQWEDVNGIAIYKGYCFLYNKNGYEFLVVTGDKRVIEAILYYLNEKKNL
ncbi:hypothetical protein [Phocaeicola sp.]